MVRQGITSERSYEIILGKTKLVVYSEHELYDRIMEMTQDDYLTNDILAWVRHAPVGDVYVDGNLVVGILGDWGLVLHRSVRESSLIII